MYKQLEEREELAQTGMLQHSWDIPKCATHDPHLNVELADRPSSPAKCLVPGGEPSSIDVTLPLENTCWWHFLPAHQDV